MKIFYGAKPKLTERDKKMFSRGDYECKVLLQNRKGEPVWISQNKNPDMPIWKVESNCFCVVFGSYEEALSYCKGRYLDGDGKKL